MLTLALPSRPATSPRYPGRSSTSVSTRASRSADTAYPAPSRASRAAPASSTSRCRTPRPSVATAQNPSMFTPTLPSSSLIVASCPGRLSASTRRSVAMVITPVVGAIESAPVIIHLAPAPAKSGGRASEPCARLAPGDPASGEPHLRFAQAAGGPVEPAGLGSAVFVGDGDGGGGQLQSGDAARLAGTGWAGPLDAGGIDVDREGEGLAGPEVGERRVEDVEAAVVEATEAVRDGADPRVAVDGEALAEGVAAGAVGVEHEVGQQAGGQVESHAGDLLRAR